MRTKVATVFLAVATAIGVLAAPSSAETVPLIGSNPTEVDLPSVVLRLVVDPGSGRLFVVAPGILEVRDPDGTLQTSLAVPDLTDAALVDDDLYLLTRQADSRGRLFVYDADTLALEADRYWGYNGTFGSDTLAPTHLAVQGDQVYWTDFAPRFGCALYYVYCTGAAYRMSFPSSQLASVRSSQPLYADIVPSPSGAIGVLPDGLRRLTDAQSFFSPVTSVSSGHLDDLALSPDGQRAVAVGGGPAVEVTTADFAPTSTTFAASSYADAVAISDDGTVAIVGDQLRLYPASGGDATASAPLPLLNSTLGIRAAPDLTRFSPDGSKLYVVVGPHSWSGVSNSLLPASGDWTLLVFDAASPDLGPFADVGSFVTQQYADALGRPATAGEMQAAEAALISGERPGALIAPLIRAEAAANPDRAAIVRLYQAAFLRPPDRNGLEYWLRRYDSGMKLTDIAANFAGSSEFQRRYGTLSNADFVKQIFLNVFGRTVDPSGLAYWTGRLDAGRSRGVVLAQWSESSEYVRKMAGLVDVAALYLVMLDRMPTAQEWADAKTALAGGTTIADGAHGLLLSPSYAARIAAT